MSTYKPYNLKIHADGMGVTAVNLTDLLDMEESNDPELRAEVTASNVSPTHVAMVSRNTMLRGTTYDIKGLLDAIGVVGLGIFGTVNPGVVTYWQKFDDDGFALSGSVHRSLTHQTGILYPRSLSCDHQGDLRCAFEMAAISDGSNAPTIVSDSAALPTITATPARWTLAGVTLGGLSFSELSSVEVDFGNNVTKRGVGSSLDATHIEQRTHEPQITLTGIDPAWFAAAKIPIGGLAVVNATDKIYFKKRTQDGTSFVANGTAEHIKLTIAGLAGVGQAGRAQAQRVSETTVVIKLARDASGNAPIVLSTASAIT